MCHGAGDVSTADQRCETSSPDPCSLSSAIADPKSGERSLGSPRSTTRTQLSCKHIRSSPPRPLIARNGSTSSVIADAAAQVASSHSLASLNPPHYDDLTPPKAPPPPPPPPALHPRIAVLLGVSTSWHIPLLIARALSTAPAMWWGLRCALTFLGDLLLSDGMGDPGDPWTVEKRFRVTEVFLAILWVL